MTARANEQAAYDCAVANKANLFRFISEFQTSVNLFELLERGGGPLSVGVFGGAFIQYRIVAARDGALNIYHFGCSLAAIRAQLADCKSSVMTVDRRRIRETVKLFNRHFPNVERVRHAIAHAGEVWDTPLKMRKEEQKAPHAGHGFSVGMGGRLLGALYERTYSIGFEGEIFSVAMDNSSVAKLVDVMKLVEEAFSKPDAQTAPQGGS